MNRVKKEFIVIFLFVFIYFIISYAIFFAQKSTIDQELSLSEAKKDKGVVIQRRVNNDQIDRSSDDLKNECLEQSEDLSKADYSFVTMPISENYQFDRETQEAFDMLLAGKLNSFFSLIDQSNNNIASQELCPSCSIYELFEKIKNHERLLRQDVLVVQQVLTNLYNFLETLGSFRNSGDVMLTINQLSALKILNMPYTVKNDMKLQSRKNATMLALQKLRDRSYVDKNG